MKMLQNSGILDTETTRLRRAAGMHEFGWLDLDKNTVKEYILNANSIALTPQNPQDVSALSSSSRDVHIRRAVANWDEVVAAEVFEGTGVRGPRQAIQDALRWSNYFAYEAEIAGTYPHLQGRVENPATRLARLRTFGVAGDLGERTSVEALIQTHIPGIINQKLLSDRTQGLTIWGANVGFESKQLGSQIAAMQQAGEQVNLKSQLETFNLINPDPMYVTGVEVNRARASAQITGDWRPVFKAYKENIPKVGEVAVRDIQDVTRSMMSYAKEARLFTGGSTYFGTGIDVSHRIAAIAKGDTTHMALSETHRAAEDAAIHEQYVLKAHTGWAEALQHSEENTSLGILYKQQAAEGIGPLAEVAKASSLLEQIAPQLNRKALIQRLQRAHEDLSTAGVTHQTMGVGSIYDMTQQTPSGDVVNIRRTNPTMKAFTSLEELGEHLAVNDHYGDFGVDVRKETQSFMQAATNRVEGNLYAEREMTSTMASIDWRALTPSIRKLSFLDRGTGAIGQAAIDVAEHIKGRPGVLLKGAAGLAAVGAAWSLVQEKPKDQTSILGFGYEEWLANQEGMASQGLAKEMRSKNTDFGSPYRGPVVSSEVFHDQEMLAERERWLRQQYGAAMYDSESGLFGNFSVFKQRGGHSYVGQGQKVKNGYAGLRGNNLVSLNLDDGWKIKVEDADTISVKRGGIRGALSSFFGLNNGYSFRLAGIDSEETAHEGRMAQPYGEQAKAALQAMMDNSKTHEIVFDPTNISYGRMMAGLVADDRNLNIEMVKQGVAAALPFGKQKDAMVDYQDIIKANDRAVEAQRGMWAQPWGQAIAAMAGPRERPTFNTLADMSKVVANSGQMSLLAIANASQKRGSFSPYMNQASSVDMTMGADKVKGMGYDARVSPSRDHMPELMMDTRSYMDSHGPDLSARGSYGKLDRSMAIDSMGTSNNIWGKRRYAEFDIFETDKARNKQRMLHMAALQQRQSAMMFQSPINHTRM